MPTCVSSLQRTKEKFKPGKCLALRPNGKWETGLAFRLNSKQNGVIKTESPTVKFTHVKGTSQWCVVYSQSRASLSPNSRIFHHPKGRPAPTSTPQQPHRICRRGHLQAQDPTVPSRVVPMTSPGTHWGRLIQKREFIIHLSHSDLEKKKNKPTQHR